MSNPISVSSARLQYWWSTKHYAWKFLQLLILAVTVPVGLFLLDQKLHFFSLAGFSQAGLSLPSQIRSNVGQEFPVPITLNTGGKGIWGTDVVVKFNSQSLKLISIRSIADKTTSLTTFVPISATGSFDEMPIIAKANTTGIIEFGALAASFTSWEKRQGIITPSFTGSAILASLRFVPLQNGTTIITLDFTLCRDSVCPTTSSNIVEDSDPPRQLLEEGSTTTVKIGNSDISPGPLANNSPSSPGLILLPKAQIKSADINGDGRVDFADAAGVISFYSHSVSNFNDPANVFNEGSGKINLFDFAVIARAIKAK